MSPTPQSKFATFRAAFVSGLLLVAPLVVTVWAFSQAIQLFGGSFREVLLIFVPNSLREIEALSFLWDLLAAVIVVGLITCLGYISRYVFGKFFVRVAEQFIENIPGISPVYRTVKQVLSTFSVQNRRFFSKAVLIQYPREGIWSLGFLTSTETGEVGVRTAPEVWAVFLPTTPNPTSGYLLFVPRKDIIELDMPVSDAMKLIISGGTMVPGEDSEATPPRLEEPHP